MFKYCGINICSVLQEMASSLLFPFLISIFIITHKCQGQNIPNFTTMLIFGDSTVDTGNNNFIPTTFKANHPPYGVDFPGQVPTGRFSNGKLVPDILASMIGLKEAIPPFLDPYLSNDDIVTGVSFASAGSGFDELTTSISNVLPVSTQVGYFRSYIQRLTVIVGEEEVPRFLGNALVLLSAGANDFIFNYYDIPTRRIQFTISEYQDFLLDKLKLALKELYDLGLRKMVLSGLPPIGCTPIQMTVRSPVIRTCSHEENVDVLSYNEKLQKLLAQTEAQLYGSRILYVDTYTPLVDMRTNPQKYGLWETNKGCCGTGTIEVGPVCSPITAICANTSQYLFWDSIHPSETTYRFFAGELLRLYLPKLSEFDNL